PRRSPAPAPAGPPTAGGCPAPRAPPPASSSRRRGGGSAPPAPRRRGSRRSPPAGGCSSASAGCGSARPTGSWRAARLLRGEELAGVHNALWVERALDRLHRRQRGAVLARHVLGADEADAVLAGDRAAHLQREPVDIVGGGQDA